MKITKAERDCFKQALKLFQNEDCNFLCCLIKMTTASAKTKECCIDLVYHYFCDVSHTYNLWCEYSNELTLEEANTCRLIALYTLIYAPL